MQGIYAANYLWNNCHQLCHMGAADPNTYCNWLEDHHSRNVFKSYIHSMEWTIHCRRNG